MRAIVLTLLVVVVTACGSSLEPARIHLAQPPLPAAGLATLPADGVQPWEQVDSRGFIIPERGSSGPQALGAGAGHTTRTPSAFASSASFSPGIERFLESSDATDNGEALALAAPTSGLSYAVYRFPMGGVQPAAWAVDLNLQPSGSATPEYWVATSDYGRGRWVWNGPYSDGRITQVIGASGNYLSSLGNFFIAIAAYDEVSLDVVGVTVSPVEDTDTTAPPVPTAPQLASANGGLEVSWVDVLAGDLAGYQLYWSYSPFTSASDNGVNALPYLENTNRLFLPVEFTREVWVGLSAVDTNGNISAVSPTAHARKVPKTRLLGLVPGSTNPTPSAHIGEPYTLTVSGADLYDFDTDGDGVYDITGDVTGSASVDTSTPGIIRPRVRGTTDGGMGVAFGSISLVVTGNQRPVASGRTTPQFGYSPLAVSYEGTGVDFDGSIVEYAWDTTGSGIYDKVSAVSGNFNRNLFSPGIYNARFRVTDDQGAWDVDTVTVQVLAAQVPLVATPPVADFGTPIQLQLDLPAGATNVEWDLDGDGSFEQNTGSTFTNQVTPPGPGRYVVTGRGTYQGDVLAGSTTVTVSGWSDVNLNDASAHMSAAASIGGRPAVAYCLQNPITLRRDLLFQLADDETGASWGAPVTAQADAGATSDRGWGVCLLELDGVPVVAGSTGGPQIYYSYALDPEGTAWSTEADVVAEGPGLNGFIDMAIVDGHPALAYWNSATGRGRYMRALDSLGQSWTAPIDVDPASTQAYGISLAVVDGFPATAFIDHLSDLRFVRATDSVGSAWGPGDTLDTSASVGYTALDIAGGRPIIAYSRSTPQVATIWANDVEGSSWPFSGTVIPGSAFGSNLDMVVAGGVPFVQWQTNTGVVGQYVARPLTPLMDAWQQERIGTITTIYGNGKTSIASVNGSPIISAGHGSRQRFMMLY